MAAFGGSVMWGAGLPEPLKFRNVVQQWLSSQLGTATPVLQIPTRAHAGAHVGAGARTDDGNWETQKEIPNDQPSIASQVRLSRRDAIESGISPHAVDLVLLEGGIHDVGLPNILSPQRSPGTVRRLAARRCVGRMEALLPEVMAAFPSAAIVVTGYYPVVSATTDLSSLIALVRAAGAETARAHDHAISLAIGAVALGRLAEASADWSKQVESGFSGVVDRLQPVGAPRLAFAHPKFADDNCYGAPRTYLWRAGQFSREEASAVVDGPVESVNPSETSRVAWTRARACKAAGIASSTCCDASMAYPNADGARAYANAIVEQLREVLWARLRLPAPAHQLRTMMVSVDEWGNEERDLEAWNWVVVAAKDSETGAAVAGRVHVQSPGGVPGYGLTGERTSYACRGSARGRGSEHDDGRTDVGPGRAVVLCTLSVTALGYFPGHLEWKQTVDIYPRRERSGKQNMP
jgi:hypothetical protein